MKKILKYILLFIVVVLLILYMRVFKKELNDSDEDKINMGIEVEQQKYSKVIDNVKFELDIPNDWRYQELSRNESNDSYKYALKLYKNNLEQCAILYIYNNKFGVCGTGRTQENILLNNGQEAVVGYYGDTKNWGDISFHDINENIAIINYDLVEEDAKEVIEFIKTIDFII